MSEQVGKPRSWLLLRGLGRETGHWGDFPDTLRAALPPQDRVLLLDLPGNGALWRERSPLAIAAMTEQVRGALRARGQGGDEVGPLHLLCLSMGGMVAVDWATRHPQEIAAVALCSSSLRGISAWWQRMRPGALLRLVGVLLASDVQRREQAVLELTSHRRPPAALPHWLALHAAHPVQRRNLLRQILAAARFRAPTARPPVPLLVLVGAGDRLVHPDCSRRIAAAWGCELAEHPSAGHDLPLDDAQWLATQLARWAATLPQPNQRHLS